MTLTCKKVCIKTTLIFHDLLYQQGLQYVFSLRDERKGKRTETETLDEGHTSRRVIISFPNKIHVFSHGLYTNKCFLHHEVQRR